MNKDLSKVFKTLFLVESFFYGQAMNVNHFFTTSKNNPGLIVETYLNVD